MREILPPVETARKICAPARPGAGPYRYTVHCQRVTCEEGALWYHTLTRELLLLSPEEEQRAQTDEALRRELIERRFLVPEAFDEYAYARQFRQVLKLLTKPKKEVTAFTVFTTTDCNARCFYCYERGRPRLPMTDRVACDAAAYIARVSGGKAVKLAWFGGEPLYNTRAIDVVTGELRARGVSFRSHMATNGYLFDEETVRKARRDWALELVQITLDGTEDRYNRIKAFIYTGGGSPYRRVMDNIDTLLAAGVRVSIRLNANRENMDDLSVLVDELAARYAGQKGLTVYSVLLRDFGPERTRPEAETEALEAWDALQQRIMASGVCGIRRLARSLRVNACMADSDAGVTILPDGRLGKCEHESEQLLVGSIYEGVTDRDMVARWKERIEVPECRTCPYYADCIRLRLCSWTGGGCTDADRARIRLSVEQSIRNEYRQYLAGDTDIGERTDESEADVDFSGFGR